MTCESCNNDSMSFVYDVSERETKFLLWECECGHKFLERRPGEAALPALVGSGASG